MISSPQDIPILAVLAMSLSMYVVGMVCICCEPKCPYCPTSVKCIQVTISGCADDNGEGACDSCGRLNGTFILYKRPGDAAIAPAGNGAPWPVVPSLSFSPCVYEAYLPPCFKTGGLQSYASRYIWLNITSPTTATFRRGARLVVEVTNLDCSTLSGSGAATNGPNKKCGGAISFNEIEQPCQTQTENENTGPCCCYVQGVSQVSVTISGWISGGGTCNCDFGVPASHAANCSVLNGTWVADLISANLYTWDFGAYNSALNCEEQDKPLDLIYERCVPSACAAWGLSDIYGIPTTPPFAYGVVGCALGSVCSCPSNPYMAYFLGMKYGGVSQGIWGPGFPSYQNNYGSYGSQITTDIEMGDYYGGDYCKFEPLEWPTERDISWAVGADPYNNANALCDRRSVTAEVVFT
jgi:hypothetical protein